MCRKFACLFCFVVVLAFAADAVAQDVGKGNILFEYFWGTDRMMYTFRHLPSFPDNPDDFEWRDSFEGRVAWNTNYGTHVRGYLYPPQTGEYTFFIASNDNSQLWLSTDEDPANKVYLAGVWDGGFGYCNTRQWTKYPSEQKTDAPIRLEAGKRYYIEALQTDGAGPDNISVGWGGPGIGAGPIVIDGQYLAPFIREVDKRAGNPKPVDGARDVTIPVFEWSAGIFAEGHKVYFGTDPDQMELVATNPKTTMLYYHLSGLTPGETYYWRVDEVEHDGTCEGYLWTFRALPLIPSDPNPANGATNPPGPVVLQWARGATATNYEVYLGTNKADVEVADKNSPEHKAMETGTMHTAGDLGQGTYFWRVDAVDIGGNVLKGDVWRFIVPSIVAEPGLVCWLMCDLGFGNEAPDWSGNGHHAALFGPEWVEGYNGGALHFRGQSHYAQVQRVIQDDWTIIFWLKTTDVGWGDGKGLVSGQVSGNQNDFGVYLVEAKINYDVGPESGAEVVSSLMINDYKWHHVAATRNATTGSLKLYIDGLLDASGSGSRGPKDRPNIINLGTDGQIEGRFANAVMDDIRLYNIELSESDIARIIRVNPLRAWNPVPGHDVAVDIEHITAISWSPGEGAIEHDVYFGDDEDAVRSADTTDTTGFYRIRQAQASYTPPEGFERAKTYYWRIDEVASNGTITEDKVWSFTVPDYLIVDDFEDYNNFEPDRVFDTWIDGWNVPENGSQVGYLESPFAEQKIVHSGMQSMPFFYDNTGSATYSEAERTWDTPQDWTRSNVNTLTVWFRGQDPGSYIYDPTDGSYTMIRETNPAEQLYVAIGDSSDIAPVVVNYPDLTAVQQTSWQEWKIDLAEFSSAGVNLRSVQKMAIGVGNRQAQHSGGAGKMYFDDIRLY